METYQLSALLEQSNEKLYKLDTAIAARIARQPDREFTKELTSKIDKHFTARLSLINAASVDSQIQEYGRSDFDNTYQRMQTIKVGEYLDTRWLRPAQIREAQAALLEAVWKALPNSPFKRFQAIFCEPQNYIVPRFSVASDGSIQFSETLQCDTASVKACLVSPHLISDELAEALGIVKFSAQERRTPKLRFLRKAEPDVLQGLKARWDNARPLTEKDLRVVVIRKPDTELAAKQRTQYPKAEPMPRGLHGTILMSREDPARKPDPSNPNTRLVLPTNAAPRQVAHFASIFSAYRKTEIQRQGADREIDELAALTPELDSINQRIRSEWRRGASEETKNEILGELKAVADKISEFLDGDTDRKKREASSRINLSKECRDSIGRLNPRSTAEQLTKSSTLLNRRLTEIAHKGGYNETDRQLIATNLRTQITVVLTALTSGLNSFSIDADVSRAQQIRALQIMDRQLAGVTVRPLSTFAGVLRIQGIKSLELLNQDKPAPETFGALVLLDGLFRAMLHLERMKTMIVRDDEIRIEALKLEHTGLLAITPNTQLQTSEVGRTVYGQLKELSDNLLTQLGEYDKLKNSEAERIVWTERLRIQLRSLDLELLVQAVTDKTTN